MERRTLAFIALAVSMLYGVGFVIMRDTPGYAALGGVVVALAWISVGVFGRGAPPEHPGTERRRI